MLVRSLLPPCTAAALRGRSQGGNEQNGTPICLVRAVADPFMLPDAKGYTALTRHLLGITDEQRQHRRSAGNPGAALETGRRWARAAAET